MKKLFYLFLLISINSILLAQPPISWQRTYGGSGADQVGNYNNDYDAPDHCLIKTSDGGFAFTGYTQSSDQDLSGTRQGNDLWIFKLDSSGNYIWSKVLVGDGDEQGRSIAETPDHGYIVAGVSSAYAGDFPSSKGLYDFAIVRLDQNGNVLWTKTYGGSSKDEAFSVTNSLDGGFYVGGYSLSNDSDVTGNHGSGDFWLLKLDGLGELQWRKCYGGSDLDWMNALRSTADGGAILAGWTYSSDGDVSSNYGSVDAWVVKIDSTGNIDWSKNYGGSMQDWGTCISSTTTGFVLSAISQSTDLDIPSNHGLSDWLVVDMDSSGIIRWSKTFGGSDYEEPYDIFQDDDGGYIVTGAARSNNGDFTGSHGHWDFCMMKTDASGNKLWQRYTGGSGGEWAVSATSTNDGGYIMAGSVSSNDLDVTFNHGNWDVWIVKLTNDYNVVSGTAYVDLNGNSVFDAGEFPAIYKLVRDSISNRVAYTDYNGIYSFSLGTGNYHLWSPVMNYYSGNPGYYSGYFSGFQSVDSLRDFAMIPQPGVTDLSVSVIPLFQFRPGFNNDVYVAYSNEGTKTEDVTITLFIDSLLSFQSATVIPDSITSDSIVWHINNLPPGASGNIHVFFNVLSTSLLGDHVDILATISCLNPDNDSLNNYSYFSSIITGSFDPNDKSVSTEQLSVAEASARPFLTYLIRFQNTGTDTAFTISVKDTLSSLLDQSTFQYVSSSHPCLISYDEARRVYTFKFNNILLPDSNVNESASHGYISYKIRPAVGLSAGNTILNKAAIYFDFNSPVITNTVATDIRLLSFLQDKTVAKLAIYPNPASNILNILGIEKISDYCKMKIYDSFGRLIMFCDGNMISQKQINIHHLSPGLYTIQFNNEDQILTVKFIKE